jgi:hypothetical protein
MEGGGGIQGLSLWTFFGKITFERGHPDSSARPDGRPSWPIVGGWPIHSVVGTGRWPGGRPVLRQSTQALYNQQHSFIFMH